MYDDIAARIAADERDLAAQRMFSAPGGGAHSSASSRRRDANSSVGDGSAANSGPLMRGLAQAGGCAELKLTTTCRWAIAGSCASHSR